MPSDHVAPPSPAPKRPGLPHRHSTNSSSQISASPSESQTSGRPGHHKPHKHVVGHGHGRMGRNPSFHRSLSKIKIAPVHAVEDEVPPTPKAKHHRRTASSGAVVSQLPPSLAELAPPSPGLRPGQGMKRNNTSVALPRLNSQTTLKKNLSSGQLTRLGSSRNVASHAHKSSRQERPDMRRAHTQPYKRHKSPAPEVRQPQPTVHWNVASEEDDDGEQMEGVDDVWTEESASASPNTTRDNTRNNTRQNSIVLDPAQNPYLQTAQPPSPPEDQPPDEPEHVDQGTSPRTQPPAVTPSTRTRDFATQDMAQQASYHQAQQLQKENEAEYEDENDDEEEEEEEEEEEDDDDEEDENDEDEDEDEDTSPDEQHRQQQHQKEQPRQPQHHPSSSFQQSRPLDTEAISKRLLEKNAPAPPRVSSISALANAASADPKSLSQTQNGNLAPTGANNTPVVSRFVGPEEGIGSKDGTPRNQSGFLRSHSRQSSNAPQQQRKQSQEGNLQRNKSAPNFSAQDRDASFAALQSPTTPGAQTPDTLFNNSRTQQKLWLQRGLSNIEATSQVHLPGAFPTGRAQAMRAPQKGMQFEFVDKEYAVVRRFHNTLLQGVERIRLANGGALPGKPKKDASTNGYTGNGTSKRPNTAKSTRSVKSMGSTSTSARSQRESAGRRALVSFHTGDSPDSGRQSPADDDDEGGDDEDEQQKEDEHNRPISAAEIARRIWESDVPTPVEV